MLNYEENIPLFTKLIHRIEIQDYRTKKMLSVASRIPKKKGGTLQPVLSLIPEKLPTKENDKGAFLTFDLKMQFDQAENARKYRKNVRKFKEGTPQQWVDLIKDLRRIWKQNGIEEGSDRVATIRSLIKGEPCRISVRAKVKKRKKKLRKKMWNFGPTEHLRFRNYG